MLKLSHLRFEILKDVIVRDFSLELKTGEIKTLFGPSGCGKTTVLRLISGLEKPQSGEIHNMFRFSISGKPPAKQLKCGRKYRYFYGTSRLCPNL